MFSDCNKKEKMIPRRNEDTRGRGQEVDAEALKGDEGDGEEDVVHANGLDRDRGGDHEA